jgi:glycosyltransferase involved in cell wall biosynthesis
MKIFYSHTSTPTYIRCLKNITALTEAGHSVIFFGAQREGGPVYDAHTFSGVPNLQVELYPHKFPHGLGSAVYLLRFLVALRCKIEKVKPDVVLLTNEELMLATPFLDKRYGIALDAIDALDIRSDSLTSLRGLIRRFVSYARGKADLVVEVEEFRSTLRPAFQNKTIIVRNTPAASSPATVDPAVSGDLNPPLPQKYIYASGSLNSGINGLETLIAAVNRFDGLHVVIAGFIKDQPLLNLIAANRDRVVFYGPLSHAQSMTLGRQALGIFAHYKPLNQNFRLAAPNKVYEAFALARPLLINSEAVISQMCREEGFGYVSPYGNVAALEQEIAHMLESRVDKSVGTRFNTCFSWGSEKKKLIAGLESLFATKC